MLGYWNNFEKKRMEFLSLKLFLGIIYSTYILLQGPLLLLKEACKNFFLSISKKNGKKLVPPAEVQIVAIQCYTKFTFYFSLHLT